MADSLKNLPLDPVQKQKLASILGEPIPKEVDPPREDTKAIREEPESFSEEVTKEVSPAMPTEELAQSEAQYNYHSGETEDAASIKTALMVLAVIIALIVMAIIAYLKIAEQARLFIQNGV